MLWEMDHLSTTISHTIRHEVSSLLLPPVAFPVINNTGFEVVCLPAIHSPSPSSVCVSISDGFLNYWRRGISSSVQEL